MSERELHRIEVLSEVVEHRNRGRRSSNRINDGVRDFALQLIRECYAAGG